MKKILLAFDSFKGSVGSLDIAKAAEKAILKVYPHCNIATFPIADGGEGTTEAICTGLNVDEGITKPEIVKDFGRCNVYTKPDCKDCFARFYCSGGCAANGYHFGGDIRGNYKIGCELQRKRVECAIMIKAALAE